MTSHYTVQNGFLDIISNKKKLNECKIDFLFSEYIMKTKVQSNWFERLI